MAITVQFLLGLLMVTQICCLQDFEFILKNGEKFTVHDTSVKFENFFFNHTHMQNLVGYNVEGAIGSKVTNLTLVLDTVNLINLDDKSEPFLIKCDTFLRSPNDEFSQIVFRALENHIQSTTCVNAKGFSDLVFSTIFGKNGVHLDAITSISKKFDQIVQGSISKYDEHQRGIDTLVDMALNIVRRLDLTYINISDIVTPEVAVRNLMIGNFSTITRTQPLKIYRKNDTLTIDATLQIKPHLFFTVRSNILGYNTPKTKLTAFARKLEVGMKLSFDYSVEPCRIELVDMNITKEKLVIRMLNQGFVATIFNTFLPYLESILTPERLLPLIKNELQTLFDSKDLRSEIDSWRSIVLSV